MKELGGLKVGNLFHLKARARQASLSKQRGFAALAARRSLQGGVRVPRVRLGSATGQEPPIFQSPPSFPSPPLLNQPEGHVWDV